MSAIWSGVSAPVADGKRSGLAPARRRQVRAQWLQPRLGLTGALLGLLGCTGCSSLPTIVPDLALPRGTAVPMQGAHGPLTVAQSQAVLARLARDSAETNIFDRHLALEQAIVGSPLTTGNRVRLLQDGPATYRAMLAAIAGARDHINMETYILEDDAVGQRFAQALIDKQRLGVQVNLMYDSVGTLATPAAFFQRLTDSGVQVLAFNPINPLNARADWALNERDHRKLLVVDGRSAFLGGINISSVYSGGSWAGSSGRVLGRADPKLTAANVPALAASLPAASAPAAGADAAKAAELDDAAEFDVAALAWRDTDLQLQGPAVAELQKLFLAAWAQQQGPTLAARAYFPAPEVVGREVVRVIGSSPEEPFSHIYATLLSAIGNAETSVHITNAYFAPDPQLLAALAAAAGRGVDVSLILPSITDSALVFHVGRSYYTDLLQAGVHIFERRGVILHAKTALIDGVWATVGSTNLDWRSFLHNYELNAVVLGREFGAQVQAMFDRDLAGSDAVLLPAWRQRPLQLRVKEMLARIWAYWL
jgi:cardiolipin synthase